MSNLSFFVAQGSASKEEQFKITFSSCCLEFLSSRKGHPLPQGVNVLVTLHKKRFLNIFSLNEMFIIRRWSFPRYTGLTVLRLACDQTNVIQSHICTGFRIIIHNLILVCLAETFARLQVSLLMLNALYIVNKWFIFMCFFLSLLFGFKTDFLT